MNDSVVGPEKQPKASMSGKIIEQQWTFDTYLISKRQKRKNEIDSCCSCTVCKLLTPLFLFRILSKYPLLLVHKFIIAV